MCISVDLVTERSKLMMAALTSAAMPNIAVAGVRGSEQTNATDEGCGIDHAVIQDATGKLYDVFASGTAAGRKRLAGRVRAAQTLHQARELAGLGFDLDHVIAFSNGDLERCATGDTTVMVAMHHVGQARSLDLLTLDDCASVGTALGAIHRLRPTFLQEAKYPAFTTGQIRAQLIAWIKRLRQAGHVPSEITTSWSNILETDGLWSFTTCPVHGGFHDGDFLFSGSSITAITNWQDMQVNDPARDLAWIFAKLDESHRNAVLSSYGRMLGNRLDDLIMLRANLWLQMEQVGDFISALNQADSARIMQFKAQVERLAHQLGVATAKTHAQSTPHPQDDRNDSRPPSTITVGTLLNESERRREAAQQPPADDDTGETDITGERNIEATSKVEDDSTGEFDVTGDFDVTGSAQIQASVASGSDATEVFGIADGHQADAHADDGEATPISTFIPEHSARELHDTMPSSATIVINDPAADDDTNERLIPQEHSEAATMIIPLLQRDEATMQQAKARIDGQEASDKAPDATGGNPQVQ
ncbi:phosphotransferase [Bifidobacterium moukalabense]|uniref:phosphotransferase n=1 Tax=Bifidobacterium moukalabense TaxID=1333651 RepID=UPI0010F79204|nr:phosphotransferase [Bifidobacterium moukalabense]